MRIRKYYLLWFLLLTVNSACQKHKSENASNPKDFHNRDLKAAEFGIGAKELVLTLDDGPSFGTAAIIDFLKKRKIPATFFMLGTQADKAEYKQLMADIAADPLFIVANHSMNHKDFLKIGTTNTIQEIKNADAILAPYMRPDAPLFMRPPYGKLSGSDKRILDVNNADDKNGGNLRKYIGPVYWDIGGNMGKGYAADWACWNQKKSVTTCRNGYFKEAVDRGGGIILAHDITTQSAEMLVGDGKSTGLIDRLIAAGFTFVPLDKLGGQALYERFGGRDPQEAEAPSAESDPNELDYYEVIPAETGIRVQVVEAGIEYFEIYVDGELKERRDGDDVVFMLEALAGAYVIEVKGYKNGEATPAITQVTQERAGDEER